MNWNRRKSLLEELMVDILRDAKKPMSLTEIMDVIQRTHPTAVIGKTPKNSLYSIIYRNEKKRTESGQPTLFNKNYIGRDVVYTLNNPTKERK